MSNPARAPTHPFELAGELAPDAHPEFLRDPEWERTRKAAKTAPVIQAHLLELDMDIMPSVTLPREWTLDPRATQSAKPVLALAKKGDLSIRVRSGLAYNLTNAIWRELPPIERAIVAPSMLDTIYVDGGAEFTLGRLQKYYPKRGADPPLRPVTWEEARTGLVQSGVDLRRFPMHALRPYPLVARYERERVISVNRKAGNGFPVLGKGDDELAMSKVMELAVSVRKELKEAVVADPNGVWNWLRRAEVERPWLVALQGKAKGDYYRPEKVRNKELRFYNAYDDDEERGRLRYMWRIADPCELG